MSHFTITLSYFGFDILNNIFSFLWFEDYSSLICASRAFHEVLVESSSLWNFNLALLLQKCRLIRSFHSDRLVIDARLLESRMLHLLARRISPWPTEMDRQSLTCAEGPDSIQVHEISTSHGFIEVFAFRGRSLGGDRTICANNYFPCLPPGSQIPSAFTSESRFDSSNRREFKRFIAPFTKVLTKGLQPRVLLSCIAYFEVSIHEENVLYSYGPGSSYNHRQASTQRQPGGPIPCVAIGIACNLFPLKERMPGWDAHSFAYHGDDGKFYHGSGFGVPCGPTFGAGDTVGCGIIYPPLAAPESGGEIFFTKNGHFVHSLLINREGILDIPHFPVVVSISS